MVSYNLVFEVKRWGRRSLFQKMPFSPSRLTQRQKWFSLRDAILININSIDMLEGETHFMKIPDFQITFLATWHWFYISFFTSDIETLLVHLWFSAPSSNKLLTFELSWICTFPQLEQKKSSDMSIHSGVAPVWISKLFFTSLHCVITTGICT